MNVLLLSPSYPRTEDDTRVPFVRAYVKELTKRGINVRIVTSSPPEKGPRHQVMDGAEIFRFNYFIPRSLQNLSYTSSSGMFESYRSSFLAKAQAPLFMLSFFLAARKHVKWCDVIDAQWLLSGFVGVFLQNSND